MPSPEEFDRVSHARNISRTQDGQRIPAIQCLYSMRPGEEIDSEITEVGTNGVPIT